MIKTNQITPFYKPCDREAALKQKQSKTDKSKVNLYLGSSLMNPFVFAVLVTKIKFISNVADKSYFIKRDSILQ